MIAACKLGRGPEFEKNHFRSGSVRVMSSNLQESTTVLSLNSPLEFSQLFYGLFRAVKPGAFPSQVEETHTRFGEKKRRHATGMAMVIT